MIRAAIVERLQTVLADVKSSLANAWNAAVYSILYSVKNFNIRVNESMLQWREHRQFKRINDDGNPSLRDSVKSRFYSALFALVGHDSRSDSMETGEPSFKESVKGFWIRIKSRIALKLSLKDRIYDFVYWLLDYDPTHHESGEQDGRLSRALLHWCQRVLLTRWIEIAGVLTLIVVGLLCYFNVAIASQ